MKTPNISHFVAMLLFLCFSDRVLSQEVRIKDLTNMRGNRPNQLLGFGLVVGLAGSGDSPKSITTNKALAKLFQRLGFGTNSSAVVTSSVAAVVVTAELPAFAKNGDRIDVKISVVGDAKSLAGGTLIQTQLRAGDGNLYAVAQGAVVLGQVTGVGGQTPVAATLPGAAMVEKEFIPDILQNGALNLSLKHPDFTTNARVAEKINQHFKGFYAESLDPAHIRVNVPPLFSARLIEFIAELEKLKVETDQKAIVVLNERTGTVVMGADVAISQVVVNHGSLNIQVGADKNAKNEGTVKMGGSSVGELVQSLNALGAKPSDLVGILQAIQAAGALKAELKFM